MAESSIKRREADCISKDCLSKSVCRRGGWEGGGGSCENYAGIVRLKLCGIAVLVSLMQYSLLVLGKSSLG